MPYFTQLMCLLASFLISNSQAIVSDSQFADMNNIGFFCKKTHNISRISINYGDGPQGLPCKVNLSKGKQTIQLLEANRSTAICEEKTRAMATRLRDRGWSCIGSGISL